MPERFPVVHAQCRRALLRRFPYGIYFVPLSAVSTEGARERTPFDVQVTASLASPDGWHGVDTPQTPGCVPQKSQDCA